MSMFSNILYKKNKIKHLRQYRDSYHLDFNFWAKKCKQCFRVSIKNTNFEQKSYSICYHVCIGNSTGNLHVFLEVYENGT